MIQPTEAATTPLADFARDAEATIRRLEETREPAVLTVDGKAAAVVLDVRSYQRLLDRLDRAEAIEGIRRGLDEMRRGETVPAEQVFAELRAEFGLSDDE